MAREIAERDNNRIPVILATSNDGNEEPRRVLVDATTGRVLVTATGTVAGEVGSATVNGQKTIATTGTAVALASATTIKNGVIVQALSANAASVYVGNASVTTANGFELQPGQATSIAINDLASVFINGTAADGVCFIGAV